MVLLIKYNDKEIDVEDWQFKHPGGTKIIKVFENRDATDAILCFHSEEALVKVNRMAGLDDDAHKQAVKSDSKYVATHAKLFQLAKEKGYFKPVFLDEFVKFCVAMIPTFFGYYLLCQGNHLFYGALFLAFGWFQLGWYGHDYSHHQVLLSSTTRAGDVCNYFSILAGSMRGTTNLWWKLRHNTHHSATNQIGRDPDIKVAPMLHFYQDFEPTIMSSAQHFYYLPLLGLLHVYWYVESLQVTKKFLSSKNLPMRKLAQIDTVGLALFTLAMLYLINPLAAGSLSRFGGLLLAFYMSGFGTALVVFASHYGEEYISDTDISVFETTSRSTRNIKGFFGFDDGLLFHLTGALSHQVEHHLFPMMPRSHIRKMTPHVKKAFADCGLPYSESNLLDCTLLAINHLYNNMVRNILRQEKSG